MRLQGWALTGWVSVALLLMGTAVLALAGTGQEGVLTWVHASARSSAVLFLAATTARPLRAVWQSRLTAWMLRNRRYLGVSVACSHALHGVAILWLLNEFPGAYRVEAVTLVFGGLGFALLAAMAITSSDAAVARLGRRRWGALHRTGVWYLSVIFVFGFFPDPESGWDPLRAAFVAAFLGAATLRAFVYTSARRRKAVTAARREPR